VELMIELTSDTTSTVVVEMIVDTDSIQFRYGTRRAAITGNFEGDISLSPHDFLRLKDVLEALVKRGQRP
jgi:hypothetical protein